MRTPSDDDPRLSEARTVAPKSGPHLQRARGIAKETVLEFVAESAAQLLSCLLLIGLAAGLFWTWQQSRVLASGAAVLVALGVALAIAAWQGPGPRRLRRLGKSFLTTLLLLALWFLFYGITCGCL